MTTTYDAAFSAPAVQAPWEGGNNAPPASLYCIRGTTYDRYDWTKPNRPWFGDAPDRTMSITGTQTDHGLFGYWDLPSWWNNSIDAAYCEDANHVYLFKKGINPDADAEDQNNVLWCLIVSLSASGNYDDMDPTPPANAMVTQPVTVASQFGYPYTVDKTTTTVFPLAKVDAAFATAGKNKKIWFFGGNQCYLIDYTTHAPEPGFQDNNGKPITLNIRDQWSNLPDDLKNGLTWAAPVLDSSGNIQDSAWLVTGNNWCPITPSTKTPRMQTYTTPGDTDPFNVPTDVTQVTVELWGPGGNGSDSASGGAGAYLRDTLTVDSGDDLTFHVGSPGDYTYYPATGDPKLAAGGGGGGGGGGGSTEQADGGQGGNGGGGRGGDGFVGSGYQGTYQGGQGGHGGDTTTHSSGAGAPGNDPGGGSGGSAGQAGSGGSAGGGGGGGGGGGKGHGGFGGGGGGGAYGYGVGAGGGGGGAQGPSVVPAGAVFKPCADGVIQGVDGDPRTPYASFDGTTGFGGTLGTPGGNGGAKITW